MLCVDDISTNKIFLVLMALICGSLSACASSPSGEIDPVILAPLKEPAKPGMANLDIYRVPYGYYASALKARIEINGERVAELGRGETFTGNYNAGMLTIATDAWGSPGIYKVRINAEPDTEYLLEITPRTEERQKQLYFGIPGLIADSYIEDEKSGTFRIVLKEVRNRNEGSTTTSHPDKTPSTLNTHKEIVPADGLKQHTSTTGELAEDDVASMSLKEKLQELNDLYESGLITHEIYLEQQRKLLEANQLQ